MGGGLAEGRNRGRRNRRTRLRTEVTPGDTRRKSQPPCTRAWALTRTRSYPGPQKPPLPLAGSAQREADQQRIVLSGTTRQVVRDFFPQLVALGLTNQTAESTMNLRALLSLACVVVVRGPHQRQDCASILLKFTSAGRIRHSNFSWSKKRTAALCEISPQARESMCPRR